MLRLVDYLLIWEGLHDINAQDDQGRSAFYWACQNGQRVIVDSLVAKEAGVNLSAERLDPPDICIVYIVLNKTKGFGGDGVAKT